MADDAAANDETIKENGLTAAFLAPEDGDGTPKEDIVIKAYGRRWYIIILFAMFPFMNALVVATWGPIASSAYDAFGFTSADIAFVSTAGLIGYIPSFPLFTWVLNKYGTRAVMMLGSSILTIGSAIRLIAGINKNLIWAIHIGQLVGSFSTPMGLCVPPALISIWVPDHQRVTVTTFLMLATAFGGAINGILGPQLVREISHNTPHNSNTSYAVGDTALCSDGSNCPNLTQADSSLTPDDIKNDILILLGIHVAILACCTILVFIYFPAKPPHPPSKSATYKRLQLREGLRVLGRNKWFWLITLTACLPNACFTTMIILLESVLAVLDYSQEMVGWIIFTSLTAAIVVPVILGSLVMDKSKAHAKMIIIILTCMLALSCLWLSLQCANIVYHNLGTMFTNVILSSIVAGSLYPLTCDVTCDMAYPVSEGLVMSVFQLFQVIALCMILGSVMIPGYVITWVVWMTFGCMVFCIPMFSICKMELKRHAIDKEHATNEQLKLTQNGAGKAEKV
ncbi:solute carrier family 49 member 4 homolog [Tubulanus polymorphus]|uniref:solute carrier family 49 member 4 homolog n=1 Tax=Tubulanus polymorphus TaxID=672921 RepID=UPI003DA6637D